MLSAFPSLFHIYNQKSVPTIFFFSNRASLPITLVSAKLPTPLVVKSFRHLLRAASR